MSTSTTLTLDDITYAAAIETLMNDFPYDFVNASAFPRVFDLQGRGSKAIKVPVLTSNMTVADRGASVDTEFDFTEGTDATTSSTQATGSVTITSAEYGVYMVVTDNVLEDTVPGLDIMEEILSNASRILMSAFEDDVCALFVNFNGGTAVGTSGSDLTLANLATAIITLRNNGVRAPDGTVFCLSSQQVLDYETAVTATNAAAAVYAPAASAYLDIIRDANNGLTAGYVGSFRGVPLFQCPFSDTANGGADDCGALLIPDSLGNRRFAAMGKTVSRPFRLETFHDVTLRGTELVASMRWGVGELADKSGIPIVTDAP